VISVAGATTLRDVLVLYTLADVLVTNDSGPGHFASMTDIHNVVLFGPETPQLFGPLGPNRHVIWAELACSPCVSPYNHRFSACSNNRCMQAISVDHVFAEVSSALSKTVRRAS
jgi:ADP-heptose:LPS heptosyltransferase